MKIVNKTEYDGRRVAGIVRWVFKELGVEDNGTLMIRRFGRLDYLVRVEHHNGDWAYNGRAWGGVGEILCKIGRPGTYPVEAHIYKRKADMPEPWVCEDWQEALVAITAHEANHLRQRQQRDMGKRKRKQRGKEQECEWAAFRLWRRWREKEGRQSAAEIMQSVQQNVNSPFPSTAILNQPSSIACSDGTKSSHQEQMRLL